MYVFHLTSELYPLLYYLHNNDQGLGHFLGINGWLGDWLKAINLGQSLIFLENLG